MNRLSKAILIVQNKVFAVFRFLLVTYPIGERGAVTRFYHEATAATDYKRGNVAYLRPKLNITPFEFHNTRPNVDKGQSPGEINLIPDATPLTCFSKTCGPKKSGSFPECFPVCPLAVILHPDSHTSI